MITRVKVRPGSMSRHSDNPSCRISGKGFGSLGEKKGQVEAIYKVQLPDGEMVWLKDQATVTEFESDQFMSHPAVSPF